MTFTVPPSKASIKQNRFEFTIGDDTFDIPLMQFMPSEFVESLAAAQQVGGLAGAASMLLPFGDATTRLGKAVRTLDMEQLDALTDAWQEASELAMGESSASTGS